MSDFSAFIEQEFDGASDGNGLVTGNVIWCVPDRSSGWAVGDPTVDGVPLKKRAVRPHPDNGAIYQAVLTYEGLVDGIDPPEDESRQWTGRITERQDPIETSPVFDKLKAQFGGVVKNGKVTWPEMIPSGTTGSGIGSSGKSSTKKNPMLNVTHYPVLLGDITYTRMVRDLPSDLLGVVGRIHTHLPASSGITTPEGYVFVRALPQWTGYGNSFRLIDTYKLTPNEDWLYWINKIVGR